MLYAGLVFQKNDTTHITCIHIINSLATAGIITVAQVTGTIRADSTGIVTEHIVDGIHDHPLIGIIGLPTTSDFPLKLPDPSQQHPAPYQTGVAAALIAAPPVRAATLL